MKSLISDDPKNGTFSAQFRWCSDHGNTTKPGPTFSGPEHQPLFHRTDKPLVINTIECGKFGGVCSSLHCREKHVNLLVASKIVDLCEERGVKDL